MPTKRQLQIMREVEMEFPETRRLDDPMYKQPSLVSNDAKLPVTRRSSLIDELAAKIEKSGCRVTFGLQPSHFEVINKHISSFDGAKYSYHVWRDIAKEIGWEPLTAALYYFHSIDEGRNGG